MLYNFFSDNFEYDECTARGACSVPPSISALQEILLTTLRQSAFYILKLKEMKIASWEAEENIINTFANVISTTDYSDAQLLSLVSNAYYNLLKIRKRYLDICEEQSIECTDLKSILSLTPEMNLSQIIALGEKSFLHKYQNSSREEKNLADVLLLVIKSVCSNISKLISFNIRPAEAVNEVLNGLNLLNSEKITPAKCKKQIKLLARTDRKITEELYNIQIKQYGGIQKTEVSRSTEKSKAILVSGSNLQDLMNLLEFSKNEEIDIYTHGEMLIAHAFEKFKEYTNLKGQFGNCTENCVLDFATFPGAILLSKNSNINTEYLYRGRLFTTSKILPHGVIAVKDNDFEELVESAKNAKGFAKGQTRQSEIIGYDTAYLEEKIDEITNKFQKGEIKKIIVLGLAGNMRTQLDYFENLVKKLPKNVFILSFSYASERENFIKLNLVNNRPLIYNVLYKLFKNIPANSDDIAFFLAKCDAASISNIINMKENGIKNIFLTNCSPNAINPAVQSFLEQTYKIKSVTSPEKDLENLGIN